MILNLSIQLNEKGQYDLDTGLAGFKKLAMNDSKYAKFEETARRCDTGIIIKDLLFLTYRY